jgi:L-threonylcarbamoyladenylate synthase
MIPVKLTDANTDELIQQAISIMMNGGTIAYPTETIYGLGAKYDDKNALKKLYALKQRPLEKTFPIIIGSVEQLSLLAEDVNNTATDLITRFWPGPLTLIFRAKSGLNSYITSNGKVAVRIPGASFALDLVRAALFPITATSANISGLPPARTAAMIADYFTDNLDLIIDGGDSPMVVPSTLVDVTKNTALILREGAINTSRLFIR